MWDGGPYRPRRAPSARKLRAGWQRSHAADASYEPCQPDLPRSSPSAAAASRWSRTARCSTTTSLSLLGRRAPARLLPADRLGRRRPLRRALLPPLLAPAARPATCRCSDATRAPAASRTTSPATCSRQDLIYVGGGNVVSMLGAWRAHGLDAILRRAWRRGIVLCGPSAGSLCWFEQALSAFHGAPRPVRGLGLLPYSNCVHYDAEPARRAEYHRFVARRDAAGGFAADDGVALHFRGTSLERAVSSRADGRCLPTSEPRRGRRDAPEVRYLGRRVARRCAGPRAAAGTAAAAALDASRRCPREHAPDPAERAAPDLRDGRRRLHDGAAQPAARRLRALAARAPREPRILFLPTASGDTSAQINALQRALRRTRRACPSTCRCSGCARPRRPLRGDRARTGHHLRRAAARCATCSRSGARTGSTRMLVQAWRRGTVLAGLSAGAMCWFEAGITRSSGPPEPLAGLGLLEGSLTVHADGEPERLPVWLRARARRRAPRRMGARRRRRAAVPRPALERAVSSRPGAGAAARRRDRRASWCAAGIEPELLGSDARRQRSAAVDEAVEELRRVHRMRRRIVGGGG